MKVSLSTLLEITSAISRPLASGHPSIILRKAATHSIDQTMLMMLLGLLVMLMLVILATLVAIMVVRDQLVEDIQTPIKPLPFKPALIIEDLSLEVDQEFTLEKAKWLDLEKSVQLKTSNGDESTCADETCLCPQEFTPAQSQYQDDRRTLLLSTGKMSFLQRVLEAPTSQIMSDKTECRDELVCQSWY